MNFNYKHVIWDWNGTLIDDSWLCVEIINEVLTKRGFPEINSNFYMQYFDFPVKNFYSKVGLDFSKESFNLLADEYISMYNERSIKCNLHQGVEDVLSKFQENGLNQSILSASKQTSLCEAVEYYSLDSYFDKICGLTDHYASGKLDLAKELIDEIGISKDHMVIVGDTTHDYEVARSSGVDCILICGGHQSRERLEACNVPVLDSIAEIKKM